MAREPAWYTLQEGWANDGTGGTARFYPIYDLVGKRDEQRWFVDKVHLEQARAKGEAYFGEPRRGVEQKAFVGKTFEAKAEANRAAGKVNPQQASNNFRAEYKKAFDGLHPRYGWKELQGTDRKAANNMMKDAYVAWEVEKKANPKLKMETWVWKKVKEQLPPGDSPTGRKR